jgi:hypothetical protein
MSELGSEQRISRTQVWNTRAVKIRPVLRPCWMVHSQVKELVQMGTTTEDQKVRVLRSMLQLPVPAKFVRSSPILVTLMMRAILSSGTSVVARATQGNIPEDGILLCRNSSAHFVSRNSSPLARFRCLGDWICPSSWLLTQRSRVRFPALPYFLSSSGSGTGSTQPREDK